MAHSGLIVEKVCLILFKLKEKKEFTYISAAKALQPKNAIQCYILGGNVQLFLWILNTEMKKKLHFIWHTPSKTI